MFGWLREKPNRGETVVLAVLVVLFSFLLTPVYLTMNADVLTRESNLTVLLYALLEYYSYFFFFIGFSFVAAAYGTDGRGKNAILIFGGALMLQYLTAYVAEGFVFGFDLSLIGEEMLNVLWNTVLAWLTLFLGWLAIYGLAFQKGRKKLGYCLCAMSAVTVRIVSRIVYDITVGAPKTFGEGLLMVLYYLSDVLLGLVGWLIVTKLTEKLTDGATVPETTSDADYSAR